MQNKKTLKELMKSIAAGRFSALCNEAGVNEADYVRLAPDAEPELHVARCLKRLWLFSKVLNLGEKVNTAKTTQRKHYPVHEVIPDEAAPRGFRLAFRGYDYGYDFARLGARPDFIKPEAAEFVGTEFHEEYVELAYWNNQCCNQ